MPDAAGKQYWESVWEAHSPPYIYDGPQPFEQHPLLRPFLKTQNAGVAIEIGCVPGRWMLYLNKEFGYRVSGIDYSDRLDLVRKTLSANGIDGVELFHEDFMSFNTAKKYDLVFSTGFVEHFDEHDEVVRRHAEIAKPGGLVVIVVPNLTHIHWLLCSLFNPELIKAHRTHLMDKCNLRRSLEKAGLRVLLCKHQKTFRPSYALPPVMQFFSRCVQKLLISTRLDEIGNPFASPYLISVSQKKL